MEKAGVRTAALHRLIQRTDREMPVVDGTDRPPHDESRMEIQDGRQIQLGAAPDHELGGVTHPALIRAGGRELPIEDIRRDRLIVIAHGRRPKSLPLASPEALGLHQPRDPFAADGNPLLPQIREHAPAYGTLLQRPALMKEAFDAKCGDYRNSAVWLPRLAFLVVLEVGGMKPERIESALQVLRLYPVSLFQRDYRGPDRPVNTDRASVTRVWLLCDGARRPMSGHK